MTVLEVLAELIDEVRRLDEDLALALGDSIADLADGASGQRGELLRTGLDIRQLRQVRGLSMADVADRMGVTVATVSRWESRKMGMNFAHALRLSAILGSDIWRAEQMAGVSP
jgi:DNA-binding transcriptional regulator YiaG